MNTKLLVLFLVSIQILVGHSFAQNNRIKKLQSQFDNSLNKNDLDKWMQRLSARPHHLGSIYDKSNAEYIDSLFKSLYYIPSIEINLFGKEIVSFKKDLFKIQRNLYK